jgi:hypothetical protein
MRFSSRITLAAALTGSLAAACGNAGSDLGLAITGTGVVAVGVFLDSDGSHTFTPLDARFPSARVALLIKGTGDTLRTAQTNAQGIALFQNVPLGQYSVAVVQASIGDSIQVQEVTPASLQVETDDSLGVDVRLGFPEVSIREARALPAGRRVFLRGTILSGVQSFRDTTSHVSDSSGQIRLTRVSLRGGLTGNTPGDSVSVLGVTSSRAGQPSLDNAIIAKFGNRPAPIPLAVGTGTAASANGGLLDAALVQITGAIILDTTTVAPDFQVRATDGSGTLIILLDGNINFNRSGFRPGRAMNVRGVLVPNGSGGWSLKPRDTADVLLL